MIDTAGDLIAFALRSAGVNGVGQTPGAEDSNDGLILLRSMVAQWQRRRWLNWALSDTSITSTGNPTYSIGGVGKDFPIPRPDRISAARAVFLPASSNPVGYPLGIIESREDWNRVILQKLSTITGAVFYETQFPDALLHFWPIPPAGQYELHIACKAAMPTFATLTDTIDMPPEYLDALIYSLAVRLAMNYGQTPAPANVQAMRAALNTIRMANAQIPTQQMPALGSHRGSGIAAGSSPSFQSGGMI